MIYTDNNIGLDIKAPTGTEYLGVTRVASGVAAGKVETIVFKDDNSSGKALKTLTITYDANGDFESIQES